MAKRTLILEWKKVFLLLCISAVMGLIYNSFDGIPLVATPSAAITALGIGLPEEDGIHLIGLDAAREFHSQRQGPVVDARSPEQFAEGHIPGAINCYLYELETFLPPLLENVTPDQPLMIYCNGADCEDSKFLAQTMQELGFNRLYIYEGGFEGWQQAGLELATGGAADQPVASGTNIKRALDFSGNVPGWLWLVGEIALLVFGLWILRLIMVQQSTAVPFAIALRVVGLVFVMASLHKIVSPEQFARIVDNYQILPSPTVNIVAIIMPWIELVCGVLLLAGRFKASSSLVLAGLTVIFIVAITLNLVRGVEFDCGCFGGGHVPPWRVLVRDVGLVLCCLPGLIKPTGDPAQT